MWAHTRAHTHNGICFDSCRCPSLLVTTCLQEVRWHLLPLHPSQVTVTQTHHQWLTRMDLNQQLYLLEMVKLLRVNREPSSSGLRWEKQRWSTVSQGTSPVLIQSKPTCSYGVPSLTMVCPFSPDPIRGCRKVVSHCEDSKRPQDTRPDPNPMKDTKGWCHLCTRRLASCIRATTANNRLQPNSPIKEPIGTDSLQRYI